MPAKPRRTRGTGGVSRYETVRGPRWRITYTVAGRRHSQGGFTTAPSARAALRTAIAEVERSGRQPARAETLGAWCQRWVVQLDKEPATVASYARQLRLHVPPDLASMRLSDVRSSDLQGWVRDLRETGLSTASIAHAATVLRQALEGAVADRLIGHNPAVGLSVKRTQAVEPEIWTPAQLGGFLEYLDGMDVDGAALYGLYAATGARRGEVAGLRWGDFSGDMTAVSVARSLGALGEGPTKGKRARMLALGAGASERIRRYRLERAAVGLHLVADDALVFPNAWGGPVDPTTLSRGFLRAQRAYRAASGVCLPPLKLHGLRHTHLSALLNAGRPVHEVAERAGHSSGATLLRTYAHTAGGADAALAATFDDLLAGGGVR